MKLLKGVSLLLCSILAAMCTTAQAPARDTTLSDLFNAIKSESDPVGMEQLLLRMEKKAAGNEGGNNTMLLDFSKHHIAGAFAEAGIAEKAQYWMEKIGNITWKESTVITVARNLIEAGKLSKAEDILKPYLGKPVTQPAGNADGFVRRPQPHEFGYQYGTILYKKGAYKKALPYLAPPPDAERGSSELYALALIGAGNNDEALREVNKLLARPGEKSDEFKNGIKKLFVKLYGNNGRYEQVMDSVATIEKKRIYDKVAGMMIQETAPAFEIKNLMGKTVSLESLKGKTVILDFWATWCIPCVGSFPGMQRAVNYYVNDTSVVFMFIHTAEKGDNATAEARKLIEKKRYTFDVYMDLKDKTTGKNPMLTAFKVGSLPTKFVIDRNGVIRFKNTGFVSENEAVDEIRTMVELATPAAVSHKTSYLRPVTW